MSFPIMKEKLCSLDEIQKNIIIKTIDLTTSLRLTKPQLGFAMYSSRNDLPGIQRLNTVHYDGVPLEHLHEHFVFVHKSTTLVMDYSKPRIRISVRGYYQNHWYSSWRTLGEYDNMRKADKSWCKAVYLVLLSHAKLQGSEQQLDFFKGLYQ